jgi:hypothetical protein
MSETPSTPKANNDGIATNSTLDYNPQSQMPPSVDDVTDAEEQKQQEQGESENELSSPEIAQRQQQSPTPSEKTEERHKSASSRPKTAPSTRSHTETEDNNHNEEPKSSRASSSSTASDDTSALLRSDNDNSPNISDNDLDNEDEQTPIATPVKSRHSNSNVIDTTNIANQENISPQSIDKLHHRDAKGEYDTSQVIQLKESFQPIINEAASYGHLDIVRKLIEVFQLKLTFLYFSFICFIIHSVVKAFTHKIYCNVHHYMKHVLVVMVNLYLNFLTKAH